MKTVIVTGGAGYIGSQTCKALAHAGFSPICYDNLSTGHRASVQWGPLVKGDVADKRLLIKTFQTYKPIAVFHFAANTLVDESETNPALYYRNNVASTLTLLEAMVNCDLKNLLFSSSCAIYDGRSPLTSISEALIPNPINPYGRTKWMAEQIMADFDQAYGLKTIALRYFNAAGADIDGQLGENHFPETHLIPRAIQTALKIRSELIIHGDGSAVRDYIHVGDLAGAHVSSLVHLLDVQESNRFNLGTGKGISILEILQAVEDVSGQKIPIRFVKKKETDPQSLVAEYTKAEKILGWAPQISTIHSIIESAYRWHLKNERIIQ